MPHPRLVPAPANCLGRAICRCLNVSLSGTLLAIPAAALAQDAQENPAQEETTETMVVVGTALKVEAPLVETPRPVSTVNREELDERNVQSLDETFRYRAGVLSGHYGADNNTDWFKVRGFDHSTYQNGLRIYREGFYQWLPEPYGLERVEVFKGPSSILYGEAPPGGLINAVSKRPTREEQGRVDLQVGNRDHRQVGLDTSGPLSESGDVRYRLVGLYKERDGDLDHTENERYYLAPSLAVDLSDDTTITFLGSFQKDDGVPTNPFKLAYGTVQDTPFGKVDPSTNYSEPGYDKDERTQSALGYEFEHHFNDTWTFEQDLRYSELDLDLRSTYILSQASATEGYRGHLQRDGEIESWTVDNRMVGKWFTERTENTLLIGIDYQDFNLQGAEGDLFSFGAPIDIFDPEYGNFTPVDDSQLIEREIDKQQLGLYLQDQLRLDDRWVLLGGVRYDSAETDNANRTSGVTQRSDDDALSWSGGVMYLGENGINPYLSYTESFEPIGRVDDGGSLYDPREGEQWELGLKYAPPGWDGYVTAAVFDLEENNTLVTSPAGFQVQEGERKSTGFELESVSYLTDNLQLTAAYTYTDARLEDDERAPLIPRHQASAWLDYAFAGNALDGLKIGGGVRYVGESVDGDIEVPDYTVVDAMASYDLTDHWRTQVNVTNLTDKEYVASCDYWCYYGESRSVIGSLSYRW
ncbi:iron complex outermembrane recepter protein [Modicisalibacter ilicicola DSM 19980]|uniref:Iron complex outermembrane recepter protein n=1 Tax=Modicisalibacter ilicicola DSM 19980 TaxID=1121942 RepID=A0A1M4WGH4_9GAMM|nr:TonB-dependent siderophore receptor [Halomonas ilicicola]SHE80285.1 iron complex outermembrane recepter protein [Halomonas ilicicola DSM 19980]